MLVTRLLQREFPYVLRSWFDVTPHELIDAIVTERGVIENPDVGAMLEAFGG